MWNKFNKTLNSSKIVTNKRTGTTGDLRSKIAGKINFKEKLNCGTG